MENEMITIAKKPGNCIRISRQEDIPDFLKDVIRIEGEVIVLDCLEGEERAPIGSVIAYEKLESGKMNVWNKANWKETTKEVDGVLYELPKPNKAIKLTEQLPDYIIDGLKGRLSVLPDGTYQLNTGWGIASCKPNQGYLVIYGKKEDGSLDANFLNMNTPSFNNYYVLDENGKIDISLKEYDAELESKLSSGSSK